MEVAIDFVTNNALQRRMRYRIVIKKGALKTAAKMPAPVQRKLKMLVNDLGHNGPVLAAWPNYSKLSQEEYHCHLTHKWVACWRTREGEIEIEVYYAGSRENAPY